MKASGIEGRDLQTSGFSVEPVYSQPPANNDSGQPFEPKIIGYRVSNNLTLRIRALQKVGALLDQAVTLGANSISGPTFTVDDPTMLQDKARSAAVADALRKGKLYAAAADIIRGPIVPHRGRLCTTAAAARRGCPDAHGSRATLRADRRWRAHIPGARVDDLVANTGLENRPPAIHHSPRRGLLVLVGAR